VLAAVRDNAESGEEALHARSNAQGELRACRATPMRARSIGSSRPTITFHDSAGRATDAGPPSPRDSISGANVWDG
jgi:hypothetical protein